MQKIPGVLVAFLAALACLAATAKAHTVMTVAAHQDDPILFMNPDLVRDLHHGWALRSIQLSSGAHENVNYMDQRNQGLEAAYAEMAGRPDVWTTHIVRSAGHQIAEATLAGSRVSIDYLALTNDSWPNPQVGQPWNGTPSTLEALERGWIHSLPAIDGTATYTRAGLVATIRDFMRRFRPDVIYTQDFVHHYGPGDHSDHRAAAFLARAAWHQYGRATLVRTTRRTTCSERPSSRSRRRGWPMRRTTRWSRRP